MCTMNPKATFPLFRYLPLELRTKIWHVALPDKDRPGLYPYRRGYWHPRWIPPGDKDFDPSHQPNIDLEFRSDLFDKIKVQLPMLFVNWEARGIALAWAHQKRFKMRFYKNHQCHILTRSFDPMHDALYIAPHQVHSFCEEATERMGYPDICDHIITMAPFLFNAAIPEALLYAEEDDRIRQIFEDFSYLRVIYIVVSRPPKFTDSEVKVQTQWDLVSPPGQRKFIWDPSYRYFDYEGHKFIGNEALYQRIEELGEELVEMLVENKISKFEIRPVLAVRG